MSDAKTQILENLSVLTNMDNIQKYLLGTKKNGSPRAVYDIVKDYRKPKKQKKKGGGNSSYSLYLNAKSGKKKHKKKKKHWHI